MPVDWDDTRVLTAEPGDYVAIARKGKGANDWFLGTITDENSRTMPISLDFLEAGKTYEANLIPGCRQRRLANQPRSVYH